MGFLHQLNQKIDLIEQKLSYTFNDKELLRLAFSHRSFANENRAVVKEHNERLEFLGDAILGIIVSDFLYRELPTYPEGELSYLRARLVEASSCAYYVHKLEIGTFLLLGRGEAMNEGKGRNSILADLFEAVIGAIYLDSGMERTQTFFLDHFRSDVMTMIREPHRNWKAELQDFCQKSYHKPPLYRIVKEDGPDHLKMFHIAVIVNGEELGSGVGSSKKESEQMAAEQAIKNLKL